MRRAAALLAVVIAVGSPVHSRNEGPAKAGHYRDSREPARIVSLIPAVTEMLFAIGAGAQVVAVSSFDTYPPEATKLPKVGALIDPDVERILSLHPDLVIVFATQTTLIAQLARAKIPVYVYKDAGLADVSTTIRELGSRVGREQAAAELARSLETRIDGIRRRVAGQHSHGRGR